MNLKDIIWNQDIANKVVEKCEYLSRFIKGHLHSNAYAAVKPKPALLHKEIEDFDKLKKEYNELKKN